MGRTKGAKNKNSTDVQVTGHTGRPLKLTKQFFKEKVEQYLAECKEQLKLPTLVGLANRLGIAESTLHDTYGKREPFASELKRVKQIASEQLIDKLSQTEKPLVNHIFLAKAIAGLRDNDKLDITTNGQPLGVVSLPKRG